MRLTVGLRSPLAFHLPGLPTLEMMKAPADIVGIEFEGREFVWHPPFEREDELGLSQYGPMVAVVVADAADRIAAAASLQRLFSAAAYAYEQPVDDGGSGLGGDGGSDAYHPFGSRAQRTYPYVYKAEAPAALVVTEDTTLHLSLAYFREGLNGTSPFYRCVAFRNVLDAVFDVASENRQKRVTAEAAARDAFIDAEAPTVAGRYSFPTPATGWATYLRHEVRNALAHVNRIAGREVNPDDPSDRVRLQSDSNLMQQLATRAIERRWTRPVQTVPR